ncbi:MAG: hypothetical protein RLZZ435_675 [Cyanobacteriota bacterium]
MPIFSLPEAGGQAFHSKRKNLREGGTLPPQVVSRLAMGTKVS